MFSSLTGNDAVKLTLKRLLAKNRLPNSVLFAGPEGVGKRQFAIETARALVCREKAGEEGCGACSACRRASAFTIPQSEKKEDFEVVFFSEHPDVGIVVPFRRNVRVDAIRALEREANFQPFEAAARVLIVDEADKMAGPAANALLKTLEEPPATTFIFLLTSRPDSLLPTIRSRCQTIRFAPVSAGEMGEFLIGERAFSHDEARLASSIAGGSIARALSIDVELYRSRRDAMLSVLRHAIMTDDLASMLKISEEMNEAKNSGNYESDLDILETLTRTIWLLANGVEPDVAADFELGPQLLELSRHCVASRLADTLSAIELLRRDLSVNINKKVATDALFLSMAAR